MTRGMIGGRGCAPGKLHYEGVRESSAAITISPPPITNVGVTNSRPKPTNRRALQSGEVYASTASC